MIARFARSLCGAAAAGLLLASGARAQQPPTVDRTPTPPAPAPAVVPAPAPAYSGSLDALRRAPTLSRDGYRDPLTGYRPAYRDYAFDELAEFRDYYNYARDNMPHVNPAFYGYQPRSYDFPDLYRPPHFWYPGGDPFYGYRDHNWSFDLYRPGNVTVGPAAVPATGAATVPPTPPVDTRTGTLNANPRRAQTTGDGIVYDTPAASQGLDSFAPRRDLYRDKLPW